MKKMPKFLKRYFWDVDFDKLDYNKYPKYVIERILEYGDERSIAWMRHNFSRSNIVDVLTSSRGLTEKSANFWAVVLGVRKEGVKCLNKSFREIRKKFWPY